MGSRVSAEQLVIEAPDRGSKVHDDDIFHPAVTTIPLKDPDTALPVPNGTIYGLAPASGPSTKTPRRSRSASGSENPRSSTHTFGVSPARRMPRPCPALAQISPATRRVINPTTSNVTQTEPLSGEKLERRLEELLHQDRFAPPVSFLALRDPAVMAELQSKITAEQAQEE
jgi:hypothetical protein